jgi:hypothetical protein
LSPELLGVMAFPGNRTQSSDGAQKEEP